MTTTLSISRVLVSTLLLLSVAATAQAASPENSSRLKAQRELEIAQLRLRLYERVEFPLRLRRLESEIKLAEAEVKSLERRRVEYQQFTKFKYSNPLLVTIEQTRLRLLEAKLRLKDLKAEKQLLCRYFNEERRLRELMIQQNRESAALLGR